MFEGSKRSDFEPSRSSADAAGETAPQQPRSKAIPIVFFTVSSELNLVFLLLHVMPDGCLAKRQQCERVCRLGRNNACRGGVEVERSLERQFH
jgi:hypothetical protein